MDKTITNVLEHLDRMLKPQRELQEQIDKLVEPQRRFQEQMRKYIEPQLRLQEHMEKYVEPYRKLEEQMQKYLEPHRRVQEHMKKYLEPQQRLQEQFERFLEPQRQLQAQIDKYLEPHRRLQDQLEKFIVPQRLLQERIYKYLQPLNHYLSDSMMNSVFIDSNGLLSVSGEAIDVDSINASLEDISGDYSDPEKFFEIFFKWLEKLGRAARIAVIYLLLPYFLSILANLTTPIYEEWWKEYALDHRMAKKEIIREANESYRPEDLIEYRFVYTSVLHVRDSGSIKSKIIDELYLGKTIKVIKKSKRWFLVEYQDPDSIDLKQGWVFSRYLHKFVK